MFAGFGVKIMDIGFSFLYNYLTESLEGYR